MFYPPGPNDPFPSVATVCAEPFSALYHCPKVWGTEGENLAFCKIYIDPPKDWDSYALVAGDPLYITDDGSGGTFVNEVSDPDGFSLNCVYDFGARKPHNVYKCGLGAPTTIQNLSALIAARGLFAYTIKNGRIYTNVPEADFALDELGDIYCIKALS